MALSDFETLAGNYKIELLDGEVIYIKNALINSCKNESFVTFLDAKELKTLLVVGVNALKCVKKESN